MFGSFISVMVFSFLIAAGVIAVWTGIGFLFHFFDASHTHHLDASLPASPPHRSLYWQAYVFEAMYNTLIVLTYPFGFLPVMQPGKFDPAGGPPIVLIPGYLMNRSCLLGIWWRLKRQGYTNVYPLNLGPMLGSIEENGNILAPKLREIQQQVGARPLYVVAHSMGGLVMRWTLAHHRDICVNQLVCLGTPHQGTRTAIFAHGANTKQMRPGSTFVKDIANICRFPIIDLFSSIDPIVMPAWSARHGERAMQFDHCGHSGLLFDIEVFDAILQHLPQPKRYHAQTVSDAKHTAKTSLADHHLPSINVQNYAARRLTIAPSSANNSLLNTMPPSHDTASHAEHSSPT